MSSDYILISEGVDELIPMQHRSPGLHVSEIIHSLCLIHGHYEASENPPRVRMELGAMHEWAITERMKIKYPGRFASVGELEKDGIYLTPDLIDTSDMSVYEIKLVWMSAKNGPDSIKLWKFWTQIKSYCITIKTLIGKLDITYVEGDYKSGDSIRHVWYREFTREELEENWRMIKTHGDRMLREMNLGRAEEIDR